MVYFFGTQICYCLTNYNEVWDSVWKKKKEKKEKISDRKKNQKNIHRHVLYQSKNGKCCGKHLLCIFIAKIKHLKPSLTSKVSEQKDF